jgi:uncharacterized protein (TIGR03437 family)
MFQRMHALTPRFFRFPIVFSVLLLSLLGRIDTAQAQGQDSLTVSPTTFTFNSPVGGPLQTTNIQVGSTAAPLSYVVSQSASGNWLAASTTSSVTPGVVTVNVNPGQMPVGTYTGTVTVTPSGASTTSVDIQINLVIATTSSISLSPSTLTFTSTAGSTAATAPQSLSVTSPSNGINFSETVAYGQTNVPAWLQVSPTSGVTNTALTVTANPTGLQVGVYTATLTVTTAQGSAQVVNVTFTIAGLPTLTSSLSTIPFYYQIGQSQTFDSSTLLTITSGNNSSVPFNLAATTASCPGFLGVSQQGPLTTPATLQVFASGLAGITQPETCSGTITVTSSSTANASLAIPVTLTVSNSALVVVNPASASFTYQLNASTPPNQNLTVSSTTSGLPFTASSNQPWLNVTPSGVTGSTGQIALNLVQAQLSNLIPGTYTANVTVTAANASNSPLTVPITLTISANSMLTFTPPFANFVYELGQQLTLNTQVIQIGSTGGPIPFTISIPTTTGTQFVSVSPLSGTTPATINVTATPGTLTGGIYNSTVSVTPTTPGANAQNIPVQLSVSNAGQPQLNVSPQTLTFNFAQGQSLGTITPQNISLSSTDPTMNLAIVSVSASSTWLTANFIPGSNTPQVLSVSINPVFLVASATPYTTNLVITTTSPQGLTGTTTVPVVLNYTSGVTLGANPTSVTFTQATGGAAPAPQSVSISASGTTGSGLPISATASTLSGGNWLSVTPASGTAPASISIALTSVAATLTAGTYQGSVVVYGQNSANANGTLTIPVTLTVTAAPALIANPVGLTFSANVAGTNPATQTLNVTVQNAISSVTFAATASTTTGGNWLSVSGPTTTPSILTVTAILLSAMKPGAYNGTITLTPSGGGVATNIPVTFNVAAQVTPAFTQVNNAASGATGGISPGEIVSIFGTGLGPVSPAGLTLNAQGNVTTTLAGVTVSFNGIPAPLTYVSSTQINCVVPFEVSTTATAQMQVSYNGATSAATAVNVQATTPGIFTQGSTGTGLGAILKPDYSVVTASNAAPRGSTIIIYATGSGLTTPAGVTGAVAGNTLLLTNANVTVTIGGIAATVVYAGSAPGLVDGVLQVNAVVPTGISAGNQPILVTAGSATSQNGVTVPVQ